MDIPVQINIAGWLACLAFVVWLALLLIKMAREIRGTDHKREVTITDDCVCRSEFEELKGDNKREHENLFSKLGGVERGVEQRLNQRLDKIESDSKDSRRRLHDDVTSIAKDVAALQSESKLTNQRIIQVDTKLDRLIERKHES